MPYLQKGMVRKLFGRMYHVEVRVADLASEMAALKLQLLGNEGVALGGVRGEEEGGRQRRRGEEREADAAKEMMQKQKPKPAGKPVAGEPVLEDVVLGNVVAAEKAVSGARRQGVLHPRWHGVLRARGGQKDDLAEEAVNEGDLVMEDIDEGVGEDDLEVVDSDGEGEEWPAWLPVGWGIREVDGAAACIPPTGGDGLVKVSKGVYEYVEDAKGVARWYRQKGVAVPSCVV